MAQQTPPNPATPLFFEHTENIGYRLTLSTARWRTGGSSSASRMTDTELLSLSPSVCRRLWDRAVTQNYLQALLRSGTPSCDCLVKQHHLGSIPHFLQPSKNTPFDANFSHNIGDISDAFGPSIPQESHSKYTVPSMFRLHQPKGIWRFEESCSVTVSHAPHWNFIYHHTFLFSLAKYQVICLKSYPSFIILNASRVHGYPEIITASKTKVFDRWPLIQGRHLSQHPFISQYRFSNPHHLKTYNKTSNEISCALGWGNPTLSTLVSIFLPIGFVLL